MQRLLVDRLPVYAAPGGRSEVDVDVLIEFVAPDLSVVLAESSQAQVSVRAAADHGHAGQQLELALAGVRRRAVAERENQPWVAAAT